MLIESQLRPDMTTITNKTEAAALLDKLAATARTEGSVYESRIRSNAGHLYSLRAKCNRVGQVRFWLDEEIISRSSAIFWLGA